MSTTVEPYLQFISNSVEDRFTENCQSLNGMIEAMLKMRGLPDRFQTATFMSVFFARIEWERILP